MGRDDSRELLDAVVIGGGPAGATAAALLGEWGRSVVLIHHEPRRADSSRAGGQPSLAESLPSSTRKLLRFLGQLEAVEAAGFHPNNGNISRWAGRQASVPATESGYHVSRAAFDRCLREHARTRGAEIVNAQVHQVSCGSMVTVEAASPTPSRYRARFALDCSGRAGVIARHGLRRANVGYRTLAIAAEWECDAWPIDERAHTVVDSYRDGWAWSVPLSPTRRQCTVMIDADRTTIRKARLESLYLGELRKALSIRDRLAGCRKTGPAWACDASLYDCTRATDGAAILVGDAASFIEPLSSAGVKKALASAWRAALVVNTCLSEPAMLAVASALHDRREREVYRECLRRSAGFFAAACAEYNDPFWSARMEGCSAGARAGEGTESVEDRLRDPAVRRIVEELRAAGAVRVTPTPGLRFGAAAVIEDREIVLREGVVMAGLEEPVRFAAGVNLPELIRIATCCREIPSVIEAYHQRLGPVDPRNLLLGIGLLVSCGLLVRGTSAA